MPRTFDAKDLIALPRLTASSAAVLMRMLLTAAENEKKLPVSLAEDKEELDTAHKSLQAVLSRRLAPVDDDNPTIREADIAEDNAWAALFHWLGGWSRLPTEKVPQVAVVATILAVIFPTNLKFTQIAVFLEWQEAELRLSLIKEKKFDVTIRKLGGGAFLDHLQQVHQHYGEVQGITAVNKKDVAALPGLKDALDEALEAIRTYTLRVSAYVRKTDPSTSELAAKLLDPLMSWKSEPVQVAAGEQQTQGQTEGQQTGTPGTGEPGGAGGAGETTND